MEHLCQLHNTLTWQAECRMCSQLQSSSSVTGPLLCLWSGTTISFKSIVFLIQLWVSKQQNTCHISKDWSLHNISLHRNLFHVKSDTQLLFTAMKPASHSYLCKLISEMLFISIICHPLTINILLVFNSTNQQSMVSIKYSYGFMIDCIFTLIN